ncbi:uncharacterized protein [Euwallacea fornicatus]|uniref:uncharacterized protein n=1 Tax=Euwallacea fornicatus TaxID=995702 RepID=UPI00338ED51C
MFIKPNWSCYISSKTWAMIMALKNVGLGLSIIILGSIYQIKYQVMIDFKTYFVCGVFIGIINLVAATVMILALIKGKENLVLLYILLEFVILFTLSIFTAMHTINPEFSIIFLSFFFLCLFIWIGLYNIYGFYVELQNYNNSAVQAGFTEIACYNNPNPLNTFPDKAVDTTVV